MSNTTKPVKVKALSYSDQTELAHIFAVHLEKLEIGSTETLHQTDRGTLGAIDIVNDMLEYLEKNNLIEVNYDL